MKPSTSFIAASIFGCLLYSSLIVLVLGQEVNPLSIDGPWELAAEHSELVVEHLGHVLAIAVASVPFAAAMLAFRARVPTSAFIAAACMSALPYLAGPVGQCLAVDGLLLCRYSWQVEALKVAVLPLILGATLRWLFGRFNTGNNRLT